MPLSLKGLLEFVISWDIEQRLDLEVREGLHCRGLWFGVVACMFYVGRFKLCFGLCRGKVPDQVVLRKC